jgi:hypothetical protein
MDGAKFVCELLAAILVIEAVHWVAWRIRQPMNASDSNPQHEVKLSFPTGGRLFAPVEAVSTLLLALFVLYISTAYIGSVAPCTALQPTPITRRIAVGTIVEAYGLLLLAEAALRKFPRRQV